MKAASVNLLSVIAAATASDVGFHYATPKEVAELLKEGLVEQNTEMTDESGKKFATRTTPKAAEYNKPEEVKPATETKSSFAIEDNVPLPAARGGRGQSVYPFEKLAVNQSFFVAATPNRPHPAKSLASTVSSAAKRQDNGRKYTVRSVEGGARVWRIA